LRVDMNGRQAYLNGRLLPLTPNEFRLLAALIQAPERTFSRQELLDRAFGYTYDGLERTIDVHIMKLRKKIETDHQNPRYIQTVYGFGYKFAQDHTT